MVKKVHIRDFKSIRDLTVELDPVTVLVGRSGTGKSNFVQALRFLRNTVLCQGYAAEHDGGWELIVPAGVEKPRTSVQVEFDVVGQTLGYCYLLQFATPGPGPFASESKLDICAERLSLGNDVLFHRTREASGNKWRWNVAPSTVSPIEPHGSIAIDRLPAIPEIVTAYTALSSGIGYYNFPTNVLGTFSGEPDKRQLQVLQQLPGMKDDASNYLDVMKSIVQNLHRPQVRVSIAASLRKLNQTLAGIELDSITNPKRAITGHRVGNKVLELNLDQESDGFRRFYAQLLALYQLPPKLVNIFEEPENGVYPGALSLLADEFKAAPADHRGQVILTTHSPGLLDHFDVDSLRVVELEGEQTVIGKVSAEQREAIGENLLTTGELLTADEARIDSNTSTSEAAGA